MRDVIAERPRRSVAIKIVSGRSIGAHGQLPGRASDCFGCAARLLPGLHYQYLNASEYRNAELRRCTTVHNQNPIAVHSSTLCSSPTASPSSGHGNVAGTFSSRISPGFPAIWNAQRRGPSGYGKERFPAQGIHVCHLHPWRAQTFSASVANA